MPHLKGAMEKLVYRPNPYNGPVDHCVFQVCIPDYVKMCVRPVSISYVAASMKES